jgi:hypothetical protein
MEEPSPSPKDRKSHPTWRLYIRGRAQRLPLATLLCALSVSLLLGGSVHYEIRLLGPRDKALQSSERSSWKVETKSIWRSHLMLDPKRSGKKPWRIHHFSPPL